MEELLVVLRQIREELNGINFALRDNTDVRKEILAESMANARAMAKILEVTLSPVVSS